MSERIKILMPLLLVAPAVLILPFAYLNSTLDPALPLRFLLLSLLVVILLTCLIGSLLRRNDATAAGVLGRIVFPIGAAYVAVVALSLFQAVNLSEAIFELSRTLIVIALLVVASIVFVRNADGITLLARCMIVSGSLLATIGICQYYGIAFTWLPGGVPPYATLVNKNLLASILSLSLAFAVYGVLQYSGFWLILSLLSFFLHVLTITVSQTRSVWVALFVSILAVVPLAYLWLRRSGAGASIRRRYWRRTALMAALLAVILVLGGVRVLLRPGQSNLTDRVASIVTAQGASAKERVALWEKSLSMFRDHPLVGVGAGNWQVVIPSYGSAGMASSAGETLYQRPHNDYLWVLTETGVFGLIFYVAIFGCILVYACRVVWRSGEEKDAVMMLAMLFGVVSYLVDSFFSFPKERIEITVFLTLMMATVIAVYHRTFPRHNRVSAGIIRSVLMLLLVVTLGASVVGVVRLDAEQHTKVLWSYRASGNSQKVIGEADKARSAFFTLDATSTPLEWYRGTANYALGRLEEACGDFRQAYRDNPNHPHVLNNLGSCLELERKHDEALEFYQKAVRAAPDFQDALLNLAAVYYNLGRYEEASTALSRVDTTQNKPRATYFRQKVAEKLRGDSLSRGQ